MKKLKMGFQCQEKHEEVYRYNQKLKPLAVKSINITDRGHYQRLAAENPGVELVYRQYVDSQPYDDPERQAEAFARLIYSKIGHIPEITLVEDYNEWIHAPPHSTPEMLDRADLFIFAFISWIHELWDERVHAVVLNASCGHFAEDIADYFPRTLARLQSCGRCLLALHEYDHPNKDMSGDGQGWLCGKFLRNLAGLKQKGYDKIRIAITECGVDSGVGAPVGSGHVGFKYWGDSASVRYLNERNLGWYIPLAQETEGVAWLTLFGCGMGGDWGSFDIKGTAVINGIGEIYSNWVPPEPEPPEPEPNGDENMAIRVFNIDKVELFGDAALDLIRFHGITVHEPKNMRQGEYYWAVVWMEEREGPACFIYTGLKEDGTPAVGQEFAWAWANDMGDADDIRGNNYPTDWQKEADVDRLNENANAGPGFGQHGWSHPPYSSGPGRAWIRDPLRWSVLLTGIGWLDMTAHRTMYATWQIKQWQGDGVEPPAPPPTNGGLLEELQGFRNDVKTKLDKIIELMGQTPPTPPTPVKEEFDVTFYNNTTLTGAPVHTMKEAPPILHSWELASPVPGIVNADNISARWVGDFTFIAKAYRFWIKSDDGFRLFVDGKEVLGKWQDQAPTTYWIDVPLTAGKHNVKLEWYEKAGGATIHLWWE